MHKAIESQLPGSMCNVWYKLYSVSLRLSGVDLMKDWIQSGIKYLNWHIGCITNLFKLTKMRHHILGQWLPSLRMSGKLGNHFIATWNITSTERTSAKSVGHRSHCNIGYWVYSSIEGMVCPISWGRFSIIPGVNKVSELLEEWERFSLRTAAGVNNLHLLSICLHRLSNDNPNVVCLFAGNAP